MTYHYAKQQLIEESNDEYHANDSVTNTFKQDTTTSFIRVQWK